MQALTQRELDGIDAVLAHVDTTRHRLWVVRKRGCTKLHVCETIGADECDMQCSNVTSLGKELILCRVSVSSHFGDSLSAQAVCDRLQKATGADQVVHVESGVMSHVTTLPTLASVPLVVYSPLAVELGWVTDMGEVIYRGAWPHATVAKISHAFVFRVYSGASSVGGSRLGVSLPDLQLGNIQLPLAVPIQQILSKLVPADVVTVIIRWVCERTPPVRVACVDAEDLLMHATVWLGLRGGRDLTRAPWRWPQGELLQATRGHDHVTICMSESDRNVAFDLVEWHDVQCEFSSSHKVCWQHRLLELCAAMRNCAGSELPWTTDPECSSGTEMSEPSAWPGLAKLVGGLKVPMRRLL